MDVCSVHHNNTFLRYSVSLLGYGFYGDVLTDSERKRWMGPARYDLSGRNSKCVKMFSREICDVSYNAGNWTSYCCLLVTGASCRLNTEKKMSMAHNASIIRKRKSMDIATATKQRQKQTGNLSRLSKHVQWEEEMDGWIFLQIYFLMLSSPEIMLDFSW